jgi:long-chain acyl-CoA synthetase
MTAALRFGDLARSPTEMEQRGARLAGGFTRLGLREGDVVAVLLRNDPVYVDIINACRTAGIAYCAINWHFKTAEIAFLMEDSGARLLIGNADLIAAARGAVPNGVPVLSVGEAEPQDIAFEPWLAAQPPYDGPKVAPRGHMAYTSGTTGRPKGVVRGVPPLDQLAASRARMARLVHLGFGVTPGSRVLMPAPLYHSAPAVISQSAANWGELLVVMPRFDAEEVLALIERHRLDVAYLVPVMYTRLLKLPEATRKRYDLSSLRYIASTGSPCAPEVKRQMIEWVGPIVYETYASSEAGLITIIGGADALAHPGSVGRALGDAVIKILDDDGKPCPNGAVGHIYVRQPAYQDFTYRHQPQARAAMEREGLITVGDMGYFDAEGYLYICDRASDMVISGGVNIYPAEIEHALLRCRGVMDCAVFGVPDAEFGERLHGVVQPEAGVAVTPAALIAELQEMIAGYKVPRTIELIETLPRDDTGKIAKRHLRDAHWQGVSRRI